MTLLRYLNLTSYSCNCLPQNINLLQPWKRSFLKKEKEKMLVTRLSFSHSVFYPIKSGYLDFSHLTELKKIYIIEIYMEKQYKLLIIIIIKFQKIFCDGVPLEGYVAS